MTRFDTNEHPLLAPLVSLVASECRLEDALGSATNGDELPEAARMSLEQLRHATDNMIRIVLGGTLRPGMEERFVEQVGVMRGQLRTVAAQLKERASEDEATAIDEAMTSAAPVPLERCIAKAAEWLADEGTSARATDGAVIVEPMA